MVLIIAVVVSFIPYTLLFLWLRGIRKEDPEYRKLCVRALGYGALSTFVVVLFSAVSNIILRLTGVKNANPLLYQALYDIIAIALMEEIAKYLFFRRLLRKNDYPYALMDMAVLMTIVGIGFGALEAVVYAIGASVPVVLVRGICLPHAGYGFVVGYFCGKGKEIGKPYYKWIGFLISWMMHGLYDFSLSEELIAINDNLVFIPLLLAVLDIVLVILLIVFIKKTKKRERAELESAGAAM